MTESVAIRTRLKVDFRALASALTLNPSFYWPFTTDVLLELYRWFVAGAERFTARHEADRDSSSTTVNAARSGILHGNAPWPQSSLWAAYGPRDEQTWQEDLRHRLLHLLVAPHFAKLRVDLGIEPLGSRNVPFARLDYNAVDEDVNALFALARAGRHLNYSPNNCHPSARLVTNIGLCPSGEGWSTVVVYSCPDGTSVWRADEPCSTQKRGEPLPWFMERARVALEAKLAPPLVPCGPPALAPWGRVRDTVRHNLNHLGIGVQCWDDRTSPAEPDRPTIEMMAAVAPALNRLADARGDRNEAIAALTSMSKGCSNAAIEARRHLAALDRKDLPSEADLRWFARVWRHMTDRAVTAPLYSTPGRTVVACFPQPPLRYHLGAGQ